MFKFLFIGHGSLRSRLLMLIGSRCPEAEALASGSLDEGLSRILHDRPIDLVLVDIDFSGPRTVETLKTLSVLYNSVRFAVISDLESREQVLASLAGGLLRGFISKRQCDEDILAAINEILAGRVYIPWALIKGDDNPMSGDPTLKQELPSTCSDLLKLTPRQHQVLCLLSLGLSNKEIAHKLSISESTTKIHTAMLMRALGVRNRTEAAFKAGKLLNAVNQPAGNPIRTFSP